MENIISDQQSLESFLRNPTAPSKLHQNSNYNLEQKDVLLRNITFEVPITLRLYYLRVLSFEKCHFKNGFEIPKESEINAETKELIFEQCHLETINIFGSNHSLIIKINSVSKLSSIQLNGSIKSLEISDPLKQNITIDKFEISSKQINDAPANIAIKDISIKYIKSKNYNGFHLNLVRTKCEYVEVTNTRNCNLSITNKCNIGHFRVSELDGDIALSNSTIAEIFIDGSDGTVSLETLWIDGIVANLLEIRNGVNAKEISFAGGNNIDLIAIGLANVEEFVIQESVINKILIPIEVFKFQIFKITGLSDMPLHINSLVFLNGIFNKGYKADKPAIILEDFTITSISFFSFNNYSNFFVSEILYNKAADGFLNQPLSDDYRYELQSNKIFIPNSLEISDIFQVISSDLGKINFIGCDFSGMNMTIKASKITEIFLSGTEMPNNLMGLPHDQQIGYAQLKKVFENRGDSVKSLDYLSLELNAHYEELKIKGQMKIEGICSFYE